jgi:hypothetical protein
MAMYRKTAGSREQWNTDCNSILFQQEGVMAHAPHINSPTGSRRRKK